MAEQRHGDVHEPPEQGDAEAEGRGGDRLAARCLDDEGRPGEIEAAMERADAWLLQLIAR